MRRLYGTGLLRGRDVKRVGALQGYYERGFVIRIVKNPVFLVSCPNRGHFRNIIFFFYLSFL